MPDSTCINDVYCQLRGLEPVSGAALAINLAYLALDRFRYSSIVQDDAVTQLIAEKNYGDSRLHRTTAFKVLCWLAADRVPAICKPVASGIDERPAGFWSWIYHYIFHKKWDEWIPFFFAFCAFSILFLGVADSIGSFSNFIGLWTGLFSAKNSLVWLAISTAFPVIFVLQGRGCVSWAASQTAKMGAEMKETAKHMAAEIDEIPPIPTEELPPQQPKQRAKAKPRLESPN